MLSQPTFIVFFIPVRVWLAPEIESAAPRDAGPAQQLPDWTVKVVEFNRRGVAEGALKHPSLQLIVIRAQSLQIKFTHVYGFHREDLRQRVECSAIDETADMIASVVVIDVVIAFLFVVVDLPGHLRDEGELH